jgi:hypothetical protein
MNPEGSLPCPQEPDTDESSPFIRRLGDVGFVVDKMEMGLIFCGYFDPPHPAADPIIRRYIVSILVASLNNQLNFNIILPSTSRLSQWSFTLKFSCQKCVCTSIISHLWGWGFKRWANNSSP